MDQRLANVELHNAILSRLAGLKKGTVVSTNDIVEEVERSLLLQRPECELARLVSEAAMLLGLVPVYDPARPRQAAFVRRRYVQLAKAAARARS